MYAAVTIMLLFVLQVTLFAAAVCLDEERQQAQHVDCCPCCSDGCVKCCVALPCCSALDTEAQSAAAPSHEQGGVSKFIEFKYCPVLLSKWGKTATIAAFLALLAVCCTMGVPNLTVEDNTRAFIPDGSYLLEYFNKQDRYFGDAGTPLYVVTPGDYDYFSNQASLAATKNDVEELAPKYLISPTKDPSSYNSWYDAYVTYCNTMGVTDYTTSEDSFYQSLHAFLQSPFGGFYNSSVVWAGPRNIAATRISSEFKAMSKWVETGEGEGRLQVDADKVVEAMDSIREVDWSVDGAYPWSSAFLTWETFKVIQQELYGNVLLAMLAVLVITTLLIGHPGCSGLVFICVAMTVLDILGCMYFWGLFIDNVSVIQSVIAIGLCVDYAAHVGHSFMLKAGTRDERVTAALSDIGAAVMNGGLSTFLAVLLLAGSKSYVFRVLFQQFFLTVVLGLGHGMILLPVLLSLIGPPCYAAVEDKARVAKASAANDKAEFRVAASGKTAVVVEPK